MASVAKTETTTPPQSLPTELLTFRLSKQISRLKELLLLSGDKGDGCETGNFDVYQRTVSWFMMGRLSKAEYDRMLERLLTSNELIDLHNKNMELLRIVFCSDGGSTERGSDLDELDNRIGDVALTLDEKERGMLACALQNGLSESTAVLDTELDLPLTLSDEHFLLDAMKHPLHGLCEPDPDGVPGVSHRGRSSFLSDRLCSQLGCLLSHDLVRDRIASLGMESCASLLQSQASEQQGPHFKDSELLHHFQEAFCEDSVAVVVSRAVEDFCKGVVESAMAVRWGREVRRAPPDSFLFPFLDEARESERGDQKQRGKPDTEHTQSDRPNTEHSQGSRPDSEHSNTNRPRSSDRPLSLQLNLPDLLAALELRPWLLGELHDEVLRDLMDDAAEQGYDPATSNDAQRHLDLKEEIGPRCK